MDARLQKCCVLGCWQYQGKQEKGRRRGRLKLENICNFQIVSAFRLRKRRQAHLSFNMCLLYLCFVFLFELNQRIHFYRANFHYILLTCWGAFKIFELAVLRHQSARKDTKLPHITIICKNHDLFNSKGLSAAAWFFLIPWINLGNKRRKHIPRSPRW